MVERWFDALTTEAEERELRSFLTTPEAVGEVFDEARAVMGFLSVGKSVRRRPSVGMKVWKVAAMVGGIVFGVAAWSGWMSERDVCEAYIHGTKYTEVALVMEQVRGSVERVAEGADGNVVERQLGDMFRVMNEETNEEE